MPGVVGRLSKVHNLLGLVVHRDGARHGAGRTVLGAARLVTALTRVVLLLHQVVARPEGHQVGVVGGGGNADGASAAHIRVAQLVCEALQLIRVKVVVIPEHVVVGGPTCSLSYSINLLLSMCFKMQTKLVF